MPRFILRFTGTGAVPADDVERWRSLPNCQIVDETPRMLLVEADEQPLRELIKSGQDWRLTPETTAIRVPDPRPKVNKPPRDQ